MEEKAVLIIVLIVAIVGILVLFMMPAQKLVVESPAYESPAEPKTASGSGQIRFTLAPEQAQATGQVVFSTR